MRYTGPRNRLARQSGIDLGLKTEGTKSHTRLLKRLNVPPGQHGVKKKKKVSERGIQLREKQKLRYIFCITEKQLKNYFKRASNRKGNTALYLSQFLESRLDNVLYRLGLVPTRNAARQLITHGHILVNGKKNNIPSYQVKIGDEVSFSSEKVAKIPYIEAFLNNNKNIIVPSWLEKKGLVGKLIALPDNSEIEKQVNLRLIIEYYSK
ncbi:MAG: 30S ribosomal protein S4 [Patescibacteria group bacterium]|nr:MAG: 30S ribosomal protein S4 [Patescibacteria group bacterium]